MGISAILTGSPAALKCARTRAASPGAHNPARADTYATSAAPLTLGGKPATLTHGSVVIAAITVSYTHLTLPTNREV